MRLPTLTGYKVHGLLAALVLGLSLGGCPTPGGDGPGTDDPNGSVPGSWSGSPTNGGSGPVAGATDERTAAFTVSPNYLNFGDSATELSFTLTNIASEDVVFEITASQTWVAVSPSSGELAVGASQVVVVTIDRAGFLPGGYSADIDIAADGFLPARVTLDATSTGTGGGGTGGGTGSGGPQLHVSTEALDFGATATSRSFLVRNRGSGELSYQCASDAGWITFSVSEGTSTGEYDTIRAYASRDGLAPGEYSASITVSAGDQQHAISVAMTVSQSSGGSGSQPPNLTISRTELVFSATQRRMSLLIRNTGSGELNFTVSSSVPWALPSMAYGAATRSYTTLSVNVDRTGLSAGEHEGVLAIVAENGQRYDVAMRMTVTAGSGGSDSAPPSLEVSTTILHLGATTTTMTFTMRNAGGGTLNHVTASDQPWLTVTPASGVVSRTVTVVRATVNRSGLAENIYTGNVTIDASDGSQVVVQVVMQVGDGIPDGSPPPRDPLRWTSSDERIDSIGGLQQYAAEGIGGRYGYPPERWAYSPVQLWLSIPFQEGYNPAWQHEAMVERLLGYNPEATWLSAISGSACRRISDMTSYPGEMIAYELIPPEYFLTEYDSGPPLRARVDMDIDAARALLADLITQEILSRNCRGVFLDNIIHPASGANRASWPEMTEYLGSITSRLNEHGKLTIANIAIVPQSLTYLGDGHDDERTAAALNGVCFETPFHWNLTRPHWDRIVSEIDMYRRWMDGGTHVELLPAWSSIVWDRDLRNAEARVLAAMVMMIRRPGDSICVPRTYYEQVPDWAFWPQALGAALDDYVITLQPVTLTREFENGTLTVDLTMSMDAQQSANAVTIIWR